VATSEAGARICLDFGTSYSKASIFLADGPPWRSTRPLQLGAAAEADTPWLAPSVMFVDGGRLLIGPPAFRAAATQTRSGREAIISFKTVLAARDLDAALSLQVKRSIDPTGSLSHREALTLYLAYLDRLTRHAIAADARLPDDAALAPRRYTTPIWRQREDADRAIGRLFDEAAAVSERLGDALIQREGVSIAQTKDALTRAAATLGIGQLETGVFEAHAAAAAYGACKEAPAQCFLLVDMGAGTTDIAGFEHSGGDRIVMSEIMAARQSCGLAGDELDQLLVATLASKKRLRDPAAADALFQSLKLGARALKRQLFETGQCRHQQDGMHLSLSRRELTGQRDYRALTAALGEIIAASLAPVRARAQTLGAPSITILLAGGGANISLLSDAVRAGAARAGGGVEMQLERLGVGWRLPPNSDASMQSALPQLAISMGGALAELETVADKALA
jgi:molecular chaperone DnaK (HSP70)